MKLKSTFKQVAVAAAWLLTGALATAEEPFTDPTAPADKLQSAAVASDGKSSAAALVIQAAKLSPKKRQELAAEYLAKMGYSEQQIAELIKTATKKKDVIRLNCVTDKHDKLKSHLPLAQQAVEALEEAVKRNDVEGQRHEFMRTAILYQKSMVLSTEAGNCVGEDASYIGDTVVEVEVESWIPSADTIDTSVPLPAIIFVPAASPFA
jgi:hypothetical protein